MRASAVTLATAGFLMASMPSGLDSCAWDEPSRVFATTRRPADLNEFLNGKIGVIQRTYGQGYLIGAFRVLSGIPLTETERQAIYSFDPGAGLPHDDIGYIKRPGFDAWQAARQAFATLGSSPPIDSYKTTARPGLIESFLNCNDDAFAVAWASLSDLSDAWGAEDPKTLDWVRAQDQVFFDCSAATPVIPNPPTADADPLFAAYRRYQIAAALFYSGQYRGAAQAFDEIGKDGDSPWRAYGPYLAARALVRSGSIDHDPAALNEGKQRLLAIVNDREQEDWHEASLRLLHRWQIKGEPGARLAELGHELMTPTDDADVGQSVYDFLYLLNQGWNKRKRETDQAELAEREKSSELAAWLLSLSDTPPSDAGGQSVERWRATHNPAWLISALLNAPDDDLPDLLAAARQIPPTAPAHEAAAYYAISRQIGQGSRQEARLWADRELRYNLTLSTRNLILAQRTELACSWKEFLQYGLRLPEPHILLDNNEGQGEFVGDPQDTSLAFDYDVIGDFNGAPLSAWMDATVNAQVPAPFRLGITEAAWLRAVVLGKDGEAKALMQQIVSLQPASASIAREFLSARNHAEVEFAAAFLFLRNPSLSPQFGSKGTDLAYAHYINGRMCWTVGGSLSNDLAFPTPAERAAARSEADRFRTAEPWNATYLAREAIDWSQSHAEDPRVPEALHRAVIAARYRCTDRDTGTYAKRAFDLLHQRYPKSAWTARTPYWYK